MHTTSHNNVYFLKEEYNVNVTDGTIWKYFYIKGIGWWKNKNNLLFTLEKNVLNKK